MFVMLQGMRLRLPVVAHVASLTQLMGGGCRVSSMAPEYRWCSSSTLQIIAAYYR